MRRSAPTYAAMGRPRRSGDRRRDHAQPAGLHGRPRHRPRSRRGRARHAEAGRRARRSPAASPARSRSAPTIPRAARPSSAGSIRGVRNGPSPDWLQQRLKAVGQRPISALVDMTNYHHARPTAGRSHVYDLAKLSGALVARRARDGEEVLALNGKTYTLDSVDDGDRRRQRRARHRRHHGRRAFGRHRGDHRHLSSNAPISIPSISRGPGRSSALTSDARTRFERGVDPAFLDDGLAIATAMALEIAGGEPSELVRAGEPPRLDRSHRLSTRRCREAGRRRRPRGPAGSDILQRLGFEVETRRDLADHRAVMASRRRRRGRHRRGSRPHPRASTRCHRRRCRARPASPGRPRPPSRRSSARCAGPPPRAGSTRR